MDRRAAWVLGIVFGGLFICLFGFLVLMYAAIEAGGSGGRGFGGGDRVGVLEVTGTIVDSKKTLEQLRDFEESDSIKAIVVRIDSPGGGVAPSQEMYEAFRKLRGKKHVVASMGSTAASGGYYIACGAEKIFADPGTLTGSIGVIMEMPNVEGLLHWAGISMNTVTSGAMKSSGSPFRPLTAQDRTYFEALLQDVHEQFIAAVAEGRGLKPEEVRPYADGRVFTGRQAKEYKLVDALGGLEDAVAEAGKLAGISGRPKMEYPQKDRRLIDELLGDEASALVGSAAARVLDRVGSPVLEYRLPVGQ
jgi:protease-4